MSYDEITNSKGRIGFIGRRKYGRKRRGHDRRSLRGSLRAVSIVRWFAVFMLAAVLSLLIALSFLQPLDLTLTQLRLEPVAFLAAVAIAAFAVGLLLWVARELGRQPIQAALASAGIKRRDMRIPAAVGVGLVGLAGICLMALFQLGGSAEHAKSMAEQQVGWATIFMSAR